MPRVVRLTPVNWLALVLSILSSAPAIAQRTAPITGDRLSGFVLPVEPVAGDIHISALRAQAWDVDDTKGLLLERDVRIQIGSFRLTSDRAVIWINRIPSADGLINQMAAYFDEVSEPTAAAGMSIDGSNLLITASARGEVRLDVAALDQKAASGAFIRRAEERLRDYLRSVTADPPLLARTPRAIEEPEIEMPPPVLGAELPRALPDLPREVELPPREELVPLFDPSGSVAINARRVEVQSGQEENIIIATGPLVVEYVDDRGPELSRLTLTAERAVIFTDPAPLEELPALALDAEHVRGVYLEGNVVASDGEYTIRGARVYYDLRTNQAIMLDGVLRTYSRDINQPVYARAEEFRQIAQNQWQAEKTIVSTSRFFKPHLAIGARRVVVTERETDDAQRTTHINARSVTLEAGGLPVFWWPRLAGTAEDFALKRLRLGVSGDHGAFVETIWDGFSLFGAEAPPGLDLQLRLDGYAERAFGGGALLEYDTPEARGLLDLYAMWDDGDSKTSAGPRIDQDNDFRGVALWEHHMELSQKLTLQAQLSLISDETFITTWREDDFEERREYESSIYLRNLDAHTAWTFLASQHFDPFISNSYLLASRQYQVDKLPELTYRRYGDSLFCDTFTYSSEYRLSYVRLQFETHSPRELGIRPRGFGGLPDEDFDDRLRARGLNQSYVARVDTRHELSLPLDAGPVNITPFIVGRVTGYSDDFEDFSSDSDDLRFFGASGVRIATTFQRIDNSVESAFFDLHRVRHLVEPNLMLWYGYASVDQGDLPVYDEEVESLANATAVRLAVDQTWQTQRGGPGRWHSVDWLMLDVALVFTSNDADREHPVPQFFEYRPEYSNLVDHWSARAAWQVSDAVAILGESIYDLDADILQRGAAGVEIIHSPAFSTFIEYRFVDASETQLLGVAWNYEFTSKYAISVRPQWDFHEDSFRSLRITLVRTFPDFDVEVSFSHDDIRNETQLSASVELAEF